MPKKNAKEKKQISLFTMEIARDSKGSYLKTSFVRVQTVDQLCLFLEEKKIKRIKSSSYTFLSKFLMKQKGYICESA